MPYPPGVDVDDRIESMRTRIETMRAWIARRDWHGLEARAETACRLLDPVATDAIADIDLTSYEDRLADGLRTAGAQGSSQVRAMYWEFDPDNGWSSAFFSCLAYSPERRADDDWASDFDDSRVLPGPDQPALAAQFASSWDATPEIASRNAYLIARTIAAFGRAAASAWDAPIPLCAGYHDQDRVFRVVAAE
jgi:hypothetical protein